MRKALILVTLFFTVVYAGDATADSNKKEKKVATEVCADGASNHPNCKKVKLGETAETPEDIKLKLDVIDEMREAIITYYKTKVIVDQLQNYIKTFRLENPEFAYASDKVIIAYITKEVLD